MGTACNLITKNDARKVEIENTTVHVKRMLKTLLKVKMFRFLLMI